MTFFDRLRYLLIGLMAALAASAILLPSMTKVVDEAVEKTTRHDIAWTGQNGREELNHLIAALQDFRFEPAKGPEAVRLRLDILFSRLQTWQNGVFGRFIKTSEDRTRKIERITALLERLDAIVADLGTPAGASDALAVTADLEPLLISIASDAFTQQNTDTLNNRGELRNFQKIQSVVIASMLVSGLLLVLLLTFQNASVRRAHEEQRLIGQRNAYLANHDILTGLPNRSSFLASLKKACKANSPGRSICVMTIDLDGFKIVNDSLGHKAGDELLVAVGARLVEKTLEVPGAHPARFGGDEFLVAIDGISGAAAARSVAEDLLEKLRMPIAINGHSIAIAATVGFVVMSGTGLSPDDLIDRADVALNKAKAVRKGAVVQFDVDMLQGLAERRQIEIDLAAANIWEEFEPFYQPVVDLATRRIVAVEALVRWRHPVRGLVSPADFIPIAERSAKIVDIGLVMLHKACADAMRFPVPLKVAVNLSAVQLIRIDVPEVVADVLARSGLPADRLKLEVTESVMINDAKNARQLVERLQAMGVTVSLDDFGTGYSSLSYLSGFNFDELKIDRSFVTGIVQDTQAAAIVQTIISLAHILGMNVVAEGIETDEQARVVAALGCGNGQGYLFGKPVSKSELVARLQGEIAILGQRAA